MCSLFSKGNLLGFYCQTLGLLKSEPWIWSQKKVLIYCTSSVEPERPACQIHCCLLKETWAHAKVLMNVFIKRTISLDHTAFSVGIAEKNFSACQMKWPKPVPPEPSSRVAQGLHSKIVSKAVNEAFLISRHNICFYGEIEKIIP